jgi:PiT family inorganic phosphate transporter
MVVILGASLFGGPVSTTHVVSSSILGVGAAQRKSQVRWGVMKDILVAWFLTVPAAAGLAAALYLLIDYLLP